jgi:hypothetical protein
MCGDDATTYVVGTRANHQGGGSTLNTLSRLELLKTGGRAIAGAAIDTAAGSAGASASEPVLSPEALASDAEKQWALLFDSTRCVGCRA